MLLRWWTIGLVLLTFASGVAAAAPPPPIDFFEFGRLASQDIASGDRLGNAVAAWEDTIVAGAPDDDDAGNRSGSAYAFQFDGSGGYRETKLVASDAEPESRFGTAVAIFDQTIVVGAPYHDETGSSSGAIYVFEPNGVGEYVERAKIAPSDSSGSSVFGYSVAVWDGVIVVGAPGDDTNGTRSGAAYVFTPDGEGGYEERKLTASDATSEDDYGIDVDIHLNTVAVGANGANPDGRSSLGAVYVYPGGATGGSVEHRLSASDPNHGDGFATSVAVWGDTVVAGSIGDDDNGYSSGSVYVFRGGFAGYDQMTKLLASDGEYSDNFGVTIDLRGDVLVVGAYDDFNAGAVYVFEASGSSGFDEVQKVTPETRDEQGAFVVPALTPDMLLVGAPGVALTGRDTGAVYVFNAAVPVTTCNGLPVTVDLARGELPTEGDDVIVGTNRPDVIRALGGDDVVCALGGSDEVVGGPGDDTIFGGPLDDTLSGNADNDTINGEGGADVIYGGSGLDTLDGGLGKDLVGGGGDADFVFGGLADDVVTGGGGNDRVISGGPGNDVVIGGGGNDNVNGDEGDDNMSGNGGRDVLRGGGGRDELRGGPNDDTLLGGPGDDFVSGNDGIDSCDGGILDEVNGDYAALSCEIVTNVP